MSLSCHGGRTWKNQLKGRLEVPLQVSLRGPSVSSSCRHKREGVGLRRCHEKASAGLRRYSGRTSVTCQWPCRDRDLVVSKGAARGDLEEKQP
jgi:hypothetical protein